jgi:hypothetical protein
MILIYPIGQGNDASWRSLRTAVSPLMAPAALMLGVWQRTVRDVHRAATGSYAGSSAGSYAT